VREVLAAVVQSRTDRWVRAARGRTGGTVPAGTPPSQARSARPAWRWRVTA